MQICRDHGVAINNPHAFILEDGKQGELNPGVVVLNPRKMRSWDAPPAD